MPLIFSLISQLTFLRFLPFLSVLLQLFEIRGFYFYIEIWIHLLTIFSISRTKHGILWVNIISNT